MRKLHMNSKKMLKSLTRSERNKIKEAGLEEQGGVCPICKFKDFCNQCERGVGKNHPGDHIWLKVNTFDHNHNCKFCKNGCRRCFRGVLHNYCNKFLSFIERHEHLQTKEIKNYLKRGLA